MKYCFFYDETEHNRKINYNTVTANNYYDNFTTAIVGWSEENEVKICKRYSGFETKYEGRKINGELKSITMKQKNLQYGFASLNKHSIEFYEDLLSIYSKEIIVYFSVFSKIEYVINQLFMDYHNSWLVDVDLMKYSIVKALLVYRPVKVIQAIYNKPYDFVKELHIFFEQRIEKNKMNVTLKERENNVFEQIILLLDDVQPISSLDWRYFAPFDGFNKLCNEMNLKEFSLVIDKEGNTGNTLNAARDIGIKDVKEGNSADYIGIRMADMFVGLISRLMKSLHTALINDSANEKVQKTLLGTEWFVLNNRQLNLYKKLYKIICIDNKYWYSTYAGIYSDDLVSFIALLQYMSHFENADEIRNDNYDMQPKNFNLFACEQLQSHFDHISNKLPVEPIANDSAEYFFNQKGAKVYKDISRQPKLRIREGHNQYMVLSVGIDKNGVPLVTIEENKKANCYRIPDKYTDWAITMVGMANSGIKILPEEVVFSLVNGKYYVDIL